MRSHSRKEEREKEPRRRWGGGRERERERERQSLGEREKRRKGPGERASGGVRKGWREKVSRGRGVMGERTVGKINVLKTSQRLIHRLINQFIN